MERWWVWRTSVVCIPGEIQKEEVQRLIEAAPLTIDAGAVETEGVKIKDSMGILGGHTGRSWWGEVFHVAWPYGSLAYIFLLVLGYLCLVLPSGGGWI